MDTYCKLYLVELLCASGVSPGFCLGACCVCGLCMTPWVTVAFAGVGGSVVRVGCRLCVFRTSVCEV